MYWGFIFIIWFCYILPLTAARETAKAKTKRRPFIFIFFWGRSVFFELLFRFFFFNLYCWIFLKIFDSFLYRIFHQSLTRALERFVYIQRPETTCHHIVSKNDRWSHKQREREEKKKCCIYFLITDCSFLENFFYCSYLWVFK